MMEKETTCLSRSEVTPATQRTGLLESHFTGLWSGAGRTKRRQEKGLLQQLRPLQEQRRTSNTFTPTSMSSLPLRMGYKRPEASCPQRSSRGPLLGEKLFRQCFRDKERKKDQPYKERDKPEKEERLLTPPPGLLALQGPRTATPGYLKPCPKHLHSGGGGRVSAHFFRPFSAFSKGKNALPLKLKILLPIAQASPAHREISNRQGVRRFPLR